MQDSRDEELIHRLQENLERIRGAAGWTSQRLADEIGVSRQTISSIENGRSTMSKTQYLAIRTVLNFEIVERGNDALAVALSQYVDVPAGVSFAGTDVDKRKSENSVLAQAVDPLKGTKTSTVAGLSMLTAALSPVLAGAAVGVLIANKSANKAFLKVFRDFAKAVTEFHSSRE